MRTIYEIRYTASNVIFGTVLYVQPTVIFSVVLQGGMFDNHNATLLCGVSRYLFHFEGEGFQQASYEVLRRLAFQRVEITARENKNLFLGIQVGVLMLKHVFITHNML